MCLLTIALTVFGLDKTLTPSELTDVWREGGVVENWTAYVFMFCALVALLNGLVYRKAVWFYTAVWSGCAVMRELDWHKKIASDSIFKSRFYSGDAPLDEKLLGGAIVILLLFMMFFFIKRIAHWVRHLRTGDGYSWLLFYAMGTMALGKILDSITRLVPAIKPFYEANRPVFVLTEEMVELLGAVLFCAFFSYALVQWQRKKPIALLG